MSRFLFCAVAAALAPSLSLADMWRLEIISADRNLVLSMSQDDDGYTVRDLEPDYMEVRVKDVVFRVQGRFDEEDSRSNLSMVRNNTFVAFNHETLGRISCNSSDEDVAGTWTRNLMGGGTFGGQFYYELVTCSDELGSQIEVPGLPFTVQGTYMLEAE